MASLLPRDPSAKKVLNTTAVSGHGLVSPVVSCVLSSDYATLSVSLAHGAKLEYSPDDASRAEEVKYFSHRLQSY